MYRTGKDVSYIKKYGMVYKGTLIINEKHKVTNLTKKNIEREIDKYYKLYKLDGK